MKGGKWWMKSSKVMSNRMPSTWGWYHNTWIPPYDRRIHWRKKNKMLCINQFYLYLYLYLHLNIFVVVWKKYHLSLALLALFSPYAFIDQWSVYCFHARKKGQFKKVNETQKGKSEEVQIKEIHVWGRSILASLRFPLNDARYLNWKSWHGRVFRKGCWITLYFGTTNARILTLKCFI